MAAKFTAENFKKITFVEMKEFIEKNYPNDKEWFKGIALDEAGKYQHLKAKREFCKKYAPELIPVIKKTKVADVLKDW